MRRRTCAALALSLTLAALGAGCGGGGGAGTPRERLQSAIDSRVDSILSDEGYGNARHVRCRRALLGAARFRCTADVLAGPDVLRETYVVALQGRCWRARQVRFGVASGRDLTVTQPRVLRGCFG